MFNIHTYEKKQRLAQSLGVLKKHYQGEKERHVAINDRLAINYKKRMENFLVSMVDAPVISQNYLTPAQCYEQSRNQQSTDKFLGDPQFYVKGFKHERDRIKESIERNKDLDFCPNKHLSLYQFRLREPEKEIHEDMHFKAKTSLERIQQFLKENMQTQLENQDFREIKKQVSNETDNASQMSFLEKRQYESRQIAKNLLPSLHIKTHFKAAQEQSNSLPTILGGYSDKRGSDQRGSSMLKKINELDVEDVNHNTDRNTEVIQQKNNRNDNADSFNAQQTSKEILVHCNIVKKRNPKVKLLKSGEGHLISTVDKSISEVYSQIFKDIQK